MLSCGSLTEIGSFESKRKPLVFFLGPFRGPFFHQGLEWFLFVLFLSVLAFTHVSRSLYLGLIGCAKTTHRLSVFAASRTYTVALTTTAKKPASVGNRNWGSHLIAPNPVVAN
jgi:hypothetical protein